MKKNINLFATLILTLGLMAPSAIHARGFVDNFLGWFSTGAGASAGIEVGRAAGKGVAHHVGEMIPDNLKKPLIVVGLVGLVAYLIYANREESNHPRAKQSRVRSCSNKGCSHKKCR